jgi:hypothetical protein
LIAVLRQILEIFMRRLTKKTQIQEDFISYSRSHWCIDKLMKLRNYKTFTERGFKLPVAFCPSGSAVAL